jgi:hypothetical protein
MKAEQQKRDGFNIRAALSKPGSIQDPGYFYLGDLLSAWCRTDELYKS